MVRVVYHDGAFIPKNGSSFDEGTEGFVVLNSPRTGMPVAPDSAERRKLLAELIEDMKNNPLPAASGRLTRDEMHERG